MKAKIKDIHEEVNETNFNTYYYIVLVVDKKPNLNFSKDVEIKEVSE